MKTPAGATGNKTQTSNTTTGAWAASLVALAQSSVVTQILRPDADTAAASWGTTPLWSKINDSSDATVISDTLA